MAILPNTPDSRSVNLPLDDKGNTYLHLLCKADAPAELVRAAVLDLGAHMHALNKDGQPPLGIAARYNHTASAQALLDLGAEQYFKTAPGKFFNALLLTAAAEHKAMAELLIAHGGGLYVNEGGITSGGDVNISRCLHHAALRENAELTHIFLQAGALTGLEAGADRAAALHIAANFGTETVIRLLVSAGADVNQMQGADGATPLHLAAQNGKLKAVQYLLRHGADANAKTRSGKTVLMMAAENGSAEIAGLLLDAGAEINIRHEGNSRETALMIAAQKGNTSVVTLLLRHGADPLLRDVFNATALAYADRSPLSRLIKDNAKQQIANAEAAAEVLAAERAYRAFKP